MTPLKTYFEKVISVVPFEWSAADCWSVLCFCLLFWCAYPKPLLLATCYS